MIYLLLLEHFEALAKPSLAKEEIFVTPDDNLQREIQAYTWIDAEGMKAQYRQALDAFIATNRYDHPKCYSK